MPRMQNRIVFFLPALLLIAACDRPAPSRRASAPATPDAASPSPTAFDGSGGSTDASTAHHDPQGARRMIPRTYSAPAVLLLLAFLFSLRTSKGSTHEL
jgi:hypothetical protein